MPALLADDLTIFTIPVVLGIQLGNIELERSSQAEAARQERRQRAG